MAKIISGTDISAQVRQEVSVIVGQLKARGTTPGLGVILVGENPASVSYVTGKKRACEEVGMYAEIMKLPVETAQESLLDIVSDLNADPRFHGILVQLPLPAQIDEKTIINAISPSKDVDGLHPVNAGKLLAGEPGFVPATPLGVQQLLLRSGYDPEGKHVVICGRSNLVGKPLAALLVQKAKGANATVTICHTRTRDIGQYTRQADILVAAMGVPRAITGDMVREGTVVIDVGVNRIEDATRKSGFRLVGDVDFEAVSQKAEAITPVPGGVGPMTIAMLLMNTLRAAGHFPA
ncbi:MAG: bifunctional 5,10-methylene-tetrahydrofolate dehydrogenase/5,10-methylene-tetrahydrofolate cyclohydrolase [Chloroflexi bacterium]|nr:bifunctional 5,10-methylene-tetrahydrofolate dehydrogenase/5,10-methylene-tetrahydrofolate cyclohydrolase [Chloroflexota bacterium]